MTPEEKTKAYKDLLQIRQEIDLLYQQGFTYFVQAVHNLGLMLIPLTKQQEALAYKLMELEAKFRDDVNKQD